MAGVHSEQTPAVHSHDLNGLLYFGPVQQGVVLPDGEVVVGDDAVGCGEHLDNPEADGGCSSLLFLTKTATLDRTEMKQQDAIN